ncbi:MAG: Inorganic phosphate transporter pho84 [Trichoglossum hirsutum]|nr:MAG: Inorganic phosphate transporter pho84 [Trichoglossum hirsutum]
MFEKLSRGSFLALFILSQFFFNFGPNATTFIYLGELFPTRYRAAAHGISSAAGKLDAITALAFDPLRRRGASANCSGSKCSPWLSNVMKIFALFMFCGLLITILLPETRRKSLEEISREQMGMTPTRRGEEVRMSRHRTR